MEDEENNSNTDTSQNKRVENEFGGGTFTFTSSQDPTENTGVYRDNTEFTLAVLNRTTPMMLAYGEKYVNSGKELCLESVFPIQFPFGLGGPKMERRTKVSEMACLQHYLRLSLPQFMRGNFILVVCDLYNRMMCYRSCLVTCKSSTENGLSFSDHVSTLIEEDIQNAAQKKTDKVHNSSEHFCRRLILHARP